MIADKAEGAWSRQSREAREAAKKEAYSTEKGVTPMKRLIQRLHQKQEGLTGLSTAIILIAFVIVASVFAYVVLSAGLYASQKVKEAVTSGLGSTMSVLELKGDVMAKMENGVLTEVYLTVGIPAAGSPVDFGSVNGTQKVVISYADAQNIFPTCNYTLQKIVDLDPSAGDLLEPNDLFLIDVDLADTGNMTIGAYATFTLEVKPPDGPVLSIERTIPGLVSEYVNLH
jgi:flagellin FlaB